MLPRLLFRQKLKTNSFCYCTQSENKKKLYSSTIFLPKTKFPLRLESKKLVERDQKVASIAEFDKLYKWQRSYLSEPEFVLHDGPPYANGNLHMGHALNKILKDTILRYQILKGHKIHYVPGWDCHGLPIELKALTNPDATPLEIRSKARDFAKSTINAQKQVFQSWGILGDWKKHYTTYNPDYVKLQFKIFNKLYQRNLIYRDVKPIYWSPSSRTALAEAELEYNEHHKSPSAFIKFKMKHVPNKSNDRIYALIWTTTPWTLPANQAICFNPGLEYSLVKNSKDDSLYIIASDLKDSLSHTLNCQLETVETLPSEILSCCTYIHPIYREKELRFLPGPHATSTKGTGLVHTAPAHGPDDFLVALENKIQINSLVDEFGCYNSSAGQDLEGKFVLEEGSKTVLQILQNNVVHLHELEHSYPYDWRTKKPVIIRASQQWFLDTDSIKKRAIEVLENVNIIPSANSDTYKRNLVNQLQKRPYWCISRQRKWGVPIPVFYNKTNESVLINEDLVRHQCMLVDNYGTDFWWKLPIEQLVPEELRGGVSPEDIEKGKDILDIWFDSGISWASVLEGDKVADLYLEGVDQITGWFQSSLLTSVALRDKAPYKNVYIHGFVVDEEGMKMSKSVGNITDPLEIVHGSKNNKAYGLDTLRWWVACHASQSSLAHISHNVLQASSDELHKIRSVIRFTLGSLYDYEHSNIDYKNFSLLDKYILHLLYLFHEQAQEAIDSYHFHQISKSVTYLLTNPVSALYFNGIKDRLYCNPLNDISRRYSQYVLLQIFEIVTQATAPIVPHLAEEMFLYLPQKNGKTYFTSTHDKPEAVWKSVLVEEVMNVVLNIKKDINKEVGANTSSAAVKLRFSPKFQKLVDVIRLRFRQRYIGCCSGKISQPSTDEVTTFGDVQTELEDIFQVSEVTINTANVKNAYELEVSNSNRFACARCRRVQSECETELCKRCSQVIETLNAKTAVIN